MTSTIDFRFIPWLPTPDVAELHGDDASRQWAMAVTLSDTPAWVDTVPNCLTLQ